MTQLAGLISEIRALGYLMGGIITFEDLDVNQFASSIEQAFFGKVSQCARISPYSASDFDCGSQELLVVSIAALSKHEKRNKPSGQAQ
jgi:hypothetical protein